MLSILMGFSKYLGRRPTYKNCLKRSHNPKVTDLNPDPATKSKQGSWPCGVWLKYCCNLSLSSVERNLIEHHCLSQIKHESMVSGFPLANRPEARKLGLLRKQKFCGRTRAKFAAGANERVYEECPTPCSSSWKCGFRI